MRPHRHRSKHHGMKESREVTEPTVCEGATSGTASGICPIGKGKKCIQKRSPSNSPRRNPNWSKPQATLTRLHAILRSFCQPVRCLLLQRSDGFLRVGVRGGPILRYSLTDFSLGRISQVSGPVGVLPVAFPGVPVDNPVSSIHGSFGAGQCASSEGFLATFTPLRARCGEVVFSYPCSSSWIVFIHIPPQAGPREPRR